ncbi:MAG: AraC family transcriptional regulator [Solirubrobacterales bacterium]
MTQSLPTGYHEIAAPPALADRVECFWWRRAIGPAADRGRILPDGRIDLVWSEGSGVLVAGPQTQYLSRPFEAPFLAIGARFHPGAAAEPLGVAASELIDSHVPLDEIDSPFASAMAERLATVRSPREIPAALAPPLADRFAELGPPDPLLRAAVAMLALGGLRVSELARAAAISERQLQRRFRTRVGYGPKTLDRVLRFQRFARALARSPGDEDGLAGHAIATGYSDQAHLTRESRALAGATPVEIRRWLAS